MGATDCLELPIYGAAYRVVLPIFDSTGELQTGAASLDSEVSKDFGTATDCTNEATHLANGVYYLDLTSTEMTAATIIGAVKSDKNDTPFYLRPLRLPAIETGTAQAGAATTVTLASGASSVDDFYVGMYVRTTGGTGSGQARKIIDYVGSTKVATVEGWTTTPDATTTYEVLTPYRGINPNTLTTADLLAQAQAALTGYGLDHLVGAAVTGTDVVDNSIIAKLVDNAATADWDNFDNTAQSLKAIAAATGLSAIIRPKFNIPIFIDRNAGTTRISIQLTDLLDDLPTTAEITPGTISIDQRAQGATSWTAQVTDAAMSEAAGVIYYDASFPTSTWAKGDYVRITLKSQKVTVASNDYEITDATGAIFYSWIPGTIDLSEATIADAVWDELVADHQTNSTFGKVVGGVGDTVWDEVMETGAAAGQRTAREFMRILAAFAAGEDATDSTSTDWAVYGMDGTTVRISGSLTAGGLRQVVTVDGS